MLKIHKPNIKRLNSTALLTSVQMHVDRGQSNDRQNGECPAKVLLKHNNCFSAHTDQVALPWGWCTQIGTWLYHTVAYILVIWWNIPRRTSIVAGDWSILQKVQLHVVVELLRRARVEGLRKVLHLSHEVIHVLLHRGEIQREALRGITPVRPVCGRRWWSSWLWVAATPEPPCAKSTGLHQHQQQHGWNHSDRCHLRW